MAWNKLATHKYKRDCYLENIYFHVKLTALSTRQRLDRHVDFLVFIIISPPLGLIITEFTLKNIITVLCCYVSLKTTLLRSLIITLITRILDTFMFRLNIYVSEDDPVV